MTIDFQVSGIFCYFLHSKWQQGRAGRAGLAGGGRLGIANDCWGTLSTFHEETSFFFWFILYSMERTTAVR